MMKVLITGGAGFVGSHLAEAYLERGDSVHIIDDLSTGALSNIKFLQESGNNKLDITIDTILNRDKLQEIMEPCDLVFHLAAAVGVRYILENPLESIITNISGTEIVMDLCNRLKKKVLITSSSEVYGKQTADCLSETGDVIYGPSSKSRWSYAASKLVDEFIALAYNRTKGLQAIIVRLFNTVGPMQTGTYGMVIPRFVSQALKGEPITVYGSGKQTRTFTYVKDVIDAMIELVEFQDAVGEVFNIGGKEEISIEDLAIRIKSMSNSDSEIKHIPYNEAFEKNFEDMERRVPCLDKIKDFIGFEPKTDIEGILKSVIEWTRIRENI